EVLLAAQVDAADEPPAVSSSKPADPNNTSAAVPGVSSKRVSKSAAPSAPTTARVPPVKSKKARATAATNSPPSLRRQNNAPQLPLVRQSALAFCLSPWQRQAPSTLHSQLPSALGGT